MQSNFPPPNWRCDSPDHNDEDGCSNSNCFKYHTPRPEWEEFNESFWKSFREMISEEEHHD